MTRKKAQPKSLDYPFVGQYLSHAIWIMRIYSVEKDLFKITVSLWTHSAFENGCWTISPKYCVLEQFCLLLEDYMGSVSFQKPFVSGTLSAFVSAFVRTYVPKFKREKK